MTHSQHHSESALATTQDDSSAPLNVDTETSTQQEIGKSFASRKIQVASLAMRSSSFGSMTGSICPLFPTSPGVAQHSTPFVVSSFSGESSTTSHFGSADHDRALLDKTWSVLAPKLESNHQHRTTKSQRRRRVTFNDVVEFFEPPPPYNDEMENDNLDSLSTCAKGGNLTDDNENGCLEENTTAIGRSTSLPMDPQQLNNPLLPTLDIQDDFVQHTNNSTNTNIPSSSTETQNSTLSQSISSISSSSSSSSSIEYNSSKINALRSPLFNQKINTSHCSLPIFQAPSSVVSLVSAPSSSSITNTTQHTNLKDFRTKGNKISKYTILDILEKRPQHHSPVRRTPNRHLPSSQAPPSFHKTLDAVQNEIKQAIERAKATSTTSEQQHQHNDRTIDEQKQDTSNQQQPSPLSNDTLSSSTTLTEVISLDNDKDSHQIKELSTPTAADNDDKTTGFDTAPSDTSMGNFGENVRALDMIMGDNSIHSDQTNKTKKNEGKDYMKQDDWVKENNDHEQLVHSPKIWHVLDCPEDTTLSMKKPSLTDPSNPDSNTPKSGRLYLKVIAAENLDFPIDNDAPSIRCSVSNGAVHLESGYYSMEHDIYFNHEFIVDDVFSETELTVTLQASQPPDTTNTKRWSKRTSWTDRKSGGDLARYIHPQDRSLAQTRISLPSIAPQCRTTLCTASFALVNGWYRPAKKSTTSSPRRMAVQEKAVGKIIIELFYLPNVHSQMLDLPVDLDACENALNIQKFHQMDWRSGYMSQLGGDVKFWRRRYFKLVGSRLYSYTDTMHSPRTWIDLAQAVELVCDHRILVATQNSNNSNSNISSSRSATYPDVEATMLVMAFEPRSSDRSTSSISSSNDLSATFNDSTASVCTSATSLSTNTSNSNNNNDHDDLSCYSVKNGFYVKFNNGDKIDFFCDSTSERDQWLHVLKLILGRIPTLPAWLSSIA